MLYISAKTGRITVDVRKYAAVVLVLSAALCFLGLKEESFVGILKWSP